MTEIVISVHDDVIWLRVTHNPDELEKLISDVRDIVSALQDKVYRQQAYQKKYKIADSDIVQAFNGDILRLAMDIRMLDPHELDSKIRETIEDFLSGLVKPSKKHLEILSKTLHFPETFFLREFTYAQPRFICKMPSWAG